MKTQIQRVTLGEKLLKIGPQTRFKEEEELKFKLPSPKKALPKKKHFGVFKNITNLASESHLQRI